MLMKNQLDVHAWRQNRSMSFNYHRRCSPLQKPGRNPMNSDFQFFINQSIDHIYSIATPRSTRHRRYIFEFRLWKMPLARDHKRIKLDRVPFPPIRYAFYRSPAKVSKQEWTKHIKNCSSWTGRETAVIYLAYHYYYYRRRFVKDFPFSFNRITFVLNEIKIWRRKIQKSEKIRIVKRRRRRRTLTQTKQNEKATNKWKTTTNDERRELTRKRTKNVRFSHIFLSFLFVQVK